jgi:hypothetical protein
MMEEITKEEETLGKDNLNRYTLNMLYKNNLGGCHNWLSPHDKK